VSTETLAMDFAMRMLIIRCYRSWVAVLGIMFGLMLSAGAMGQEAVKPLPLARYFPRRDLVVYGEFDGLDAHRDAWTKSAAYRLLTETTTGAMLEQSAARALDLFMAGQRPAPAKGRELVELGKHLMRSGFAVGINRAGGAGMPRCLAMVVRGGANGPTRTVLERFLTTGEGARHRVKRVEKPGGRAVRVLGDSPPSVLSWWAEGADLVVSLVAPTGVDAIIAALDGREPSAVDQPTRAALRKGDDAPGFEPVGLAFFDMAALPAMPREAVALGLDRIKRFDYRWGFHGPAIQSILGAVAPSPRTGIPALFDQPTFDVRHLPPLPGGLTAFTVFSLDAVRLYDQVSAAVKALDPRASQALGPMEDAVRQATGLRLREDFLAPLGSRTVLYTVPTRTNAPPNVLTGLAQAILFAPKSVVVIEVKDRAAVAKALEALALAQQVNSQAVPPAQAQGPTVSLALNQGTMRRLKGPDVEYVFPPSLSSIAMPMGMRQTIVLGPKELVWGMTPTVARGARDQAERAHAVGLPSGDPLARALDQLPDRLIFLTINDESQSILPELLVSVPNLVDSATSWQGLRLMLPFEQLMPFRVVSPFRVPPSPPPSPTSPEAQPGAPFDPELVPEPDALRPFLFPSVSVLAVDDQGVRFLSREAFPTINPATAVPVAIAMLVPAAHSAHLAAKRAQSLNNLKQVGLALHNFHSTHNHFPNDVRGKDGKPLLSWRVQILPFLEQQGLFNEFQLDEPWDGPHNKALLDRMPAVFAIPGEPAEPGMTFYRGFSGPRTLFDPNLADGVGIASITDGTSNTLAVVEARDAVPWTKPGSDVPFVDDVKPETFKALLGPLGGHASGGFNALFCDGSARFIKDTINPLVLRSLITRDAGEVISSDSF